MDKPVVIASRQSPLAVAQSKAVRALLADAHGIVEEDREEAFPIITFVTVGDKNLADSLANVGGKGLFVKEIERALITSEAQIAVHSMKDMPAIMPEGLMLGAVPAREDPRDAFVTLEGKTIEDLAEGAVVGTSSVRREAQLLRRRPDLKVVPFRGNVGTRLGKLEAGEAEGTFLAEAGLKRLGHDEVKRHPVSPDVMLPALAQGVLCLQCREDDEEAQGLLDAINKPDVMLTTEAERAFLQTLDGSCRTPMAGLATLEGDTLQFSCEILSLDGKEVVTGEHSLTLDDPTSEGSRQAAAEMGRTAAQRLLGEASPSLKSIISGA